MALLSILAFFITLAMIVALAPIARRFRLVDTPSSRKRHDHEIPLVGGIAIFLSLALVSLALGTEQDIRISVKGNDALWEFMACGAFLVVTGVLDDKFQLGVFVRILSEVLVAFAVIELLNLQVSQLGDLANTGRIRLDPVLSYPFTVIAIFGIINAFNMLDGMDGLLALLVITTLALFHLMTETPPGLISLAVSASLLAFTISNLNMTTFIPKTFLGDAGSKLLGFIVVCLVLAAASAQVGEQKLIKPVTTLYVVALPLFDMVFTSLRRVMRGRSPFAADRSHIHHLMQELGFTNRRALILILSIHSFLAAAGLALHRAGVAEYHQFSIFLVFFVIYSLLCSWAWGGVAKTRQFSVGE